MTKKKEKISEIDTAEKILSIVFDALSKGQFNYHVAKLKGKTEDGNTEEMVATKLNAIDTKRLLEAVTALEKIVNLKNKADGKEIAEASSKIILPEVEYPKEEGGEAQ